MLYGNDSSFRSRNPLMTNAVGAFDFGLSSNGELLRLFDVEMNLVDYVLYGTENSWVQEPNGGGPSLELINQTWDNILAGSWRSSPYLGGSPGLDNKSSASTRWRRVVAVGYRRCRIGGDRRSSGTLHRYCDVVKWWNHGCFGSYRNFCQGKSPSVIRGRSKSGN